MDYLIVSICEKKSTFHTDDVIDTLLHSTFNNAFYPFINDFDTTFFKNIPFLVTCN